MTDRISFRIFMKKFVKEKIAYNPKKKPLVSVVIPSFNRFEYLINAVDSVKNQSYLNFEIVIVNDGSSDERYKKYNLGKKVKMIHLEQNQKKINGFGPGSIRNFGTDASSGDILAST